MNVNIGYSLITFPTLVLLCLSFLKKFTLNNTLYPAYVMMLIRMILRTSDLEETKRTVAPDVWNNKENYQLTWGFLMTTSFLIYFWKY